MRQSGIQVVVFDAVGTLIYPEPDVALIYTDVARRFGSKLNCAEVKDRFRQAFKEANGRDAGARTSEKIEYERWRRIVARVLHDVGDAEGCFSELFAHFARPASWRLFPDVSGTLTGVRSKGCRVGVASNFDSRLLEIIGTLDPKGHIEFVMASSQIGFRKPHREFFDAIVSHAAVEAASIVYVGDELDNDVAAARSAGLHALLVDRDRPDGHAAIKSLCELVWSVL